MIVTKRESMASLNPDSDIVGNKVIIRASIT